MSVFVSIFILVSRYENLFWEFQFSAKWRRFQVFGRKFVRGLKFLEGNLRGFTLFIDFDPKFTKNPFLESYRQNQIENFWSFCCMSPVLFRTKKLENFNAWQFENYSRTTFFISRYRSQRNLSSALNIISGVHHRRERLATRDIKPGVRCNVCWSLVASQGGVR